MAANLAPVAMMEASDEVQPKEEGGEGRVGRRDEEMGKVGVQECRGGMGRRNMEEGWGGGMSKWEEDEE